MPEVQEVFRMATQKVRPDPGAMERQHREQRRRTMRRKAGVYGLVAAIAIGAAVVAANMIPADRSSVPLGQPSGSKTAPGAAAPVGTVTSDGSTCSMEITADRIEPGIVLFEVVNATDQRAMFDSWQLLDGYTVRAFAATIERDRRRAEPWIFPDQKREVSYLGSEVIPANSSGSIVTTMSPGPHAIVCMQPYEDPLPAFPLRPFGVVGPIVVR